MVDESPRFHNPPGWRSEPPTLTWTQLGECICVTTLIVIGLLVWVGLHGGA